MHWLKLTAAATDYKGGKIIQCSFVAPKILGLAYSSVISVDKSPLGNF